MEIQFSEINNFKQDNLEQGNNNDNYSYDNYWESPKTINTNSYTNQSSKPKVTYNDILSSLNVVVQNGVLQKINIPKPQPQSKQNSNFVKNSNLKQINNNNVINNNKLEPALKNSYIFNKYFKNYKGEYQGEDEDEVIKPLTKEEYKKLLIDNYIKRINDKIRIAQIKSKKIQYTNTDNFVIKSSYNTANLNRLFRF